MAKRKRRPTRRHRVALAKEQPTFFRLPGEHYEERDGELFYKPHPFDVVETFLTTCALCGESGSRPRDFAIAYLHQYVTEHHRAEQRLRVTLTLERG